MADIVDDANERNEFMLQVALKNKAPVGPRYKGKCYNCDEKLPPDLRWCDADCRDEWERRSA